MNARFEKLVAEALCLIAGIATAACLFSGCRSVPCPQPPEVSTTNDLRVIGGLAANLQQLPITANLTNVFADAAVTTYSTLNDANAGFLLLTRAIGCLLKEAGNNPAKLEIVKAAVPELIQTARGMWAAKVNQKGGLGTLSSKEKEILGSSRYGPEIRKHLAEYGIQ